MGSMFGGTKNQTTTNQSTSTSTPWAAQAPYLQNMFAQAQSIFNQNQAMGTPYDQGINRFADPTQSQRNAVGYMQGAGNQIYGIGQQGFDMGANLDSLQPSKVESIRGTFSSLGIIGTTGMPPGRTSRLLADTPTTPT